MNKEDYDKAIADYTEAIRIKPDYASAYNNRGNAYHNKEDYAHARADWEKFLELDPNATNATTVRSNLQGLGMLEALQRARSTLGGEGD